LRVLTDYVFERYPTLRRFEGQTREDNIAMRKVFVRSGWVKEAHYRQAWPIEGAEPKASIAYGVLRCDCETETITPVDWDDLPA
jgi:RimJ/RimL family protein N-acetyltransferase